MVISLQQHRDVTEQTYQHRPIGLALRGISEKNQEREKLLLFSFVSKSSEYLMNFDFGTIFFG